MHIVSDRIYHQQMFFFFFNLIFLKYDLGKLLPDRERSKIVLLKCTVYLVYQPVLKKFKSWFRISEKLIRDIQCVCELICFFSLF